MVIKCFASSSSFWIDPQGRVRPCARFRSNAGHISSFSSCSEILNSSLYLKLREEHINGNWTTDCQRCKEDEEKKIKSKRSFYEDLELRPGIDFLIDVSVGNFCNLKCRMCGPQNSTMWASDYKMLLEKKLVPEFKTALDGYQLNDQDVDKLCTHLVSVEGNIAIELKGGEPMIMPRTEFLMKKFSELPNAKRIRVLIVTNGTFVPNWLRSVASKIGKLQVIVSVDGIGDVYDYIRGNEKFDFAECLKNINLLNSMKELEVRFNVVLQNLNIHQAFDIHSELVALVGSKINYLTLSGPGYLAVNVMPKKARDRILCEFESRKNHFGDYQNQMENIFDLLRKDPPIGAFDRFLEISALLDRSRNQNLFSVLPHLGP